MTDNIFQIETAAVPQRTHVCGQWSPVDRLRLCLPKRQSQVDPERSASRRVAPGAHQRRERNNSPMCWRVARRFRNGEGVPPSRKRIPLHHGVRPHLPLAHQNQSSREILTFLAACIRRATTLVWLPTAFENLSPHHRRFPKSSTG